MPVIVYDKPPIVPPSMGDVIAETGNDKSTPIVYVEVDQIKLPAWSTAFILQE